MSFSGEQLMIRLAAITITKNGTCILLIREKYKIEQWHWTDYHLCAMCIVQHCTQTSRLSERYTVIRTIIKIASQFKLALHARYCMNHKLRFFFSSLSLCRLLFKNVTRKKNEIANVSRCRIRFSHDRIWWRHSIESALCFFMMNFVSHFWIERTHYLLIFLFLDFFFFCCSTNDVHVMFKWIFYRMQVYRTSTRVYIIPSIYLFILLFGGDVDVEMRVRMKLFQLIVCISIWLSPYGS